MDTDVSAPGCAILLASMVENLSHARGLSEVMTIVKQGTRALTGADGATLVLRDHDKCYYADEDAISPLWKGQRFPLQACISGWVMLNRQAVSIDDIYADERIPADAYRPTFVASLMMVPIRRSSPIGAIGAYWAKTCAPRSEHVLLLQSLADVTSVTLSNLELQAETRRQSAALKAAVRAKDEFLCTLSHELRTPLTAILGWADILSAEGLGCEDAEEGLDTILRNAHAQAQIIDNLLDTSSIVTGGLTLDLEELDLIPHVQTVFDRLALKGRAKGLTFLYEAPLPSLEVSGDPKRLQQILTNLLQNAVEFTPAGGTVELRLFRRGPSAVIQVSDSGEGIEASALPHIFDRFVQADGSLTRAHGGLGLGLAIARQLAEAHGGCLSAESAGKGHGATFTVELPATMPAVAAILPGAASLELRQEQA